MLPNLFFKSLADTTRLKCVLLLSEFGELCVCDLVCALTFSQPKISRHLALLKKDGVVTDRRQGQWVYYRLAEELPNWAKACIELTLAHHHQLIGKEKSLLQAAANDQHNHCC